QPPGEAQGPVVADPPEVAGVEVALVVDRVLGWHLHVAPHQGEALEDDLTLLAGTERATRLLIEDPRARSGDEAAVGGALVERGVGGERRRARERLAAAVARLVRRPRRSVRRRSAGDAVGVPAERRDVAMRPSMRSA